MFAARLQSKTGDAIFLISSYFRRLRYLGASILLILLLLPCLVAAQDPYYRTIDESDGLPSNSVYGLFQDSKGFIWVTTDDGLARYDGHTFKSFASSQQSSRAGTNIFEDPMGRIWYENFDGRLYFVTGDTLAALLQDSVTGFARSGCIGDCLYVPVGEQVSMYDLNTLLKIGQLDLRGSKVSGTNCKGEHSYWVSGQTDQMQIDAAGKVMHFPRTTDRLQFGMGTMFDYQDKIFLIDYFVPEKGIGQWTHAGYRQFAPLLSKGSIQQHAFASGRLWVCFTQGMEVIDVASASHVEARTYFPDKSISAVLVDHEGNHWLGTTNEGLMLIPDFSSHFIPAADVGFKRIVCNGEDLVIGTHDGKLLRFERGTGQFHLLHHYENRHAIDFLMMDEGRILDGNPTGHLRDMRGHESLGTKNLAIKDAVRVSDHYMAVSSSGSSGLVRAPVGTSSSMDVWDSIALAHQQPLNPDYFDPFVGRGRAVAHLPGSEVVYFATSNGLMRSTPHEFHEVTYQGGAFYGAKLQAGVHKVYALSTLGDFFVIDNQGTITPIVDLPVGPPYTQMKLLGDNLYLLGRKQLLQLDIAGKRPVLRNMISGLQPGRINDFCLHGDQLALATDDGLILLNPDVKMLAGEPILRITGLHIAGKSHSPDAIVEVGYLENEIEIDYAILNFSTGGDFPLYYRINGGTWSKINPDARQLLLAQLAPGNYDIEFCLGAAGSKVAGAVHVYIRKPFWAQWWFYGLLGLLLATVAALILQQRNKVVQRKHSLNMEKLALENSLRLSTLTAIRSQMNPHFFFNALNTIQAFIFSDDKKKAINYLGKFSKLTRMVLEMSEKEYVSLAEEILAITLYLELEKSRFGDDFQFQIELGVGLSPNAVSLPSMIIQPFVENAVKHGLLHRPGSKELQVTFGAVGNMLLIEVHDNGIGRKRSEELKGIRQGWHQPFSVNANKKRIDILNEGLNRIGVEYVDRQDANGEACGTTVKITLPLDLKATTSV